MSFNSFFSQVRHNKLQPNCSWLCTFTVFQCLLWYKDLFWLTAWVWSVLAHVWGVKCQDEGLMASPSLHCCLRTRRRCRNCRLMTVLSDRPRQPPIASAKCWPSTRRMSRWWRTTRSWPVMWVWNMTRFNWRLLCGFFAHMFSVKRLFFFSPPPPAPPSPLSSSAKSSCWNGSVAPSPGCRTESGRRLWVRCRQSRRTSETTAVSTSHPRFEFTAVL